MDLFWKKGTKHSEINIHGKTKATTPEKLQTEGGSFQIGFRPTVFVPQ